MPQFGKKQSGRPMPRRTSANPRVLASSRVDTREDLSPQAQSFLKSQKRSKPDQPDMGGLGGIKAGAPRTAGFTAGRPVAGRRLFSYLIDGLLFSLVWFFAIFPALNMLGVGGGGPPLMISDAYGNQMINPDATLASIGFEFMIAQYLLRIVYSVAFEASGLQATPGKMALGLIVVNRNHDKPSLSEVIGRNTWGRFISYVTPLMIGVLMALFRQDKKALHDMLAGTQVCKKAPAGASNYSEVFA